MLLGLKKRNNENVYIFIDESGKPEIFSHKGVNLVERGNASKYLILSAIRCSDQLNLQQMVTAFKSKLLQDKELTKIFSSSYSLDNFHASIDYIEVKERFYNFIKSLKGIKIDVIVVNKLNCHIELQKDPSKLYGFMSGHLLKNICHQAKETEIIFSRKDSKLKLRQSLEIEVERIRLNFIKEHPQLDTGFKLIYHHNPHYSHSGLQIADYVSHAIFKLYERDDDRWYKIIQPKIGAIQDICNKKYFTRSKPLQLST